MEYKHACSALSCHYYYIYVSQPVRVALSPIHSVQCEMCQYWAGDRLEQMWELAVRLYETVRNGHG
jgi:hypothetical protein